MGYRIEYGAKPKRHRRKKKTAAVCIVSAGLILLCLLAGYHRAVTAPGETGMAVRSLVSDLSDGIPAGEAVRAFCREIIAGAELPE